MGVISKGQSLRRGMRRVYRNHGIAESLGWAAFQWYDQCRRLTGVDLYDYVSTNVYEEDWDLLVILDACRVDLLAGIASDYEFIGDIDSVYSVAEDSVGWLDSTFVSEYEGDIRDTMYVTGNPHTEIVFPEKAAENTPEVDNVWRYAFDDERGLMPARPITDRTITACREKSYDRVIAHYMQPHFPAVGNLELGSEIHLDEIGNIWDSIWDDIKTGEIDPEIVWEAYQENLEYVLEDVQLLLSNINAERVLITADHANAFGEFGYWGHRRHPIPSLRRVPVCVTAGTDEGTYTPRTTPDTEQTTSSVDDQLEALGYR